MTKLQSGEPSGTSLDQPVRLLDEGGVAVITIDSPPLNLLSAVVRAGLRDCLLGARGIDGLKAVVLIAAGKTFIAGADITEFGKPRQKPSLRDLQELIEAFPVPVVAAMHGTALGGGFELALACHFRIAARGFVCGLPEVRLGLLPGAGGTQRLPRLAGLEAALRLIAGGEKVPADEALRLGIVDAVCEEASLFDAAIAFARKACQDGWAGRLARAREVRLPAGADAELICGRFVERNKRRWRGAEAPLVCVEAVKAAATVPFDEGLELERRLFAARMASAQSKAMRYAFFAERKAGRVPDVSPDMPTRPVSRIGVVGAGTMGRGIALSFLAAGFQVELFDSDSGALTRCREQIAARIDEARTKGRVTAPEAQDQFLRLNVHSRIDDLAPCDLVVEAVFEDLEVKTRVMTRLAAICREGAILATNTSYLDVDVLARATGRAADVVGLHFFSPANIMRLLEIVRGNDTAPEVVATALWVAKRLGKVGVVVGVAHGFVGNRMLAKRQKQANRLVLEGALPWDIDRVLTKFGFPMGPFAMGDLAGLDLGWTPDRSKGKTLKERLCEIGRRGQKTGAGYYDYREGRKPLPSDVTVDLVETLSREQGIVRRAIGDEEILERCLLPLINEGFEILREGKVYRASDIDVVWLHGYGWPAYRGGPIYYAEDRGLASIVKAMGRLRADFGEDFDPSPYLLELACRGGSVLEQA